MNVFRIFTAALLTLVTYFSFSQQIDDPFEDGFDALDAELEQQFLATDESLEKQFLRIKQAVDDAYSGLTDKISVNWQSDIKLPEKSSWVTYDESYTSRAQFDFAKGYYQVETIVEDDIAASLLKLKAMATAIASADQKGLQEQDVFNNEVKRQLGQSFYVESGFQTVNQSVSVQHINVTQVLPINTESLIDKVRLADVNRVAKEPKAAAPFTYKDKPNPVDQSPAEAKLSKPDVIVEQTTSVEPQKSTKASNILELAETPKIPTENQQFAQKTTSEDANPVSDEKSAEKSNEELVQSTLNQANNPGNDEELNHSSEQNSLVNNKVEVADSDPPQQNIASQNNQGIDLSDAKTELIEPVELTNQVVVSPIRAPDTQIASSTDRSQVVEKVSELVKEQEPEKEPESTSRQLQALQPQIDFEQNGSVKKLVLTIPFINNYQQSLIETRLEKVKSLAKQYDIDTSLILAVIETESSFNPMATSAIPAFGLMQLVPKTAGLDAYKFVHGQKRLVTPEYLYDQDNNLLLGTAYLHLLSNRYLRGITDKQSKLYCMLASYNTGVGNLAKSFVNRKNLGLAIKRANTMNSEQVYRHLMQNLPADETKQYLKKVISRQVNYAHFDQI